MIKLFFLPLTIYTINEANVNFDSISDNTNILSNSYSWLLPSYYSFIDNADTIGQPPRENIYDEIVSKSSYSVYSSLLTPVKKKSHSSFIKLHKESSSENIDFINSLNSCLTYATTETCFDPKSTQSENAQRTNSFESASDDSDITVSIDTLGHCFHNYCEFSNSCNENLIGPNFTMGDLEDTCKSCLKKCAKSCVFRNVLFCLKRICGKSVVNYVTSSSPSLLDCHGDNNCGISKRGQSLIKSSYDLSPSLAEGMTNAILTENIRKALFLHSRLENRDDDATCQTPIVLSSISSLVGRSLLSNMNECIEDGPLSIQSLSNGGRNTDCGGTADEDKVINDSIEEMVNAFYNEYKKKKRVYT